MFPWQVNPGAHSALVAHDVRQAPPLQRYGVQSCVAGVGTEHAPVPLQNSAFTAVVAFRHTAAWQTVLAG